MSQPTQGQGPQSPSGHAPHAGTSYYRIVTRDTAGNRQELYAAFRSQEFVLFQMEGALAQVMYLLPATTPEEIGRVVTERIIDVVEAKLLAERPAIDAAMLLTSHPWTEMQRGIVGVILETRDVR
jgi:hypothetical protein